jgi:hypothetical protein
MRQNGTLSVRIASLVYANLSSGAVDHVLDVGDILLVQPAAGARAARELQSFELPLMAQLTGEGR